MTKILITGGAGFIGSNFTRYIINKYPEYQVTVFDALTYAGNLENLEDLKDKFTFIKGDIRNLNEVQPALKDQDYIVNFAAESHVDRSILEADSFITTNIYGTFCLLQAARATNPKIFLHISTDEVYGSIQEGSFTENSILNPTSPYAASKACADLLALSYYKTYNLPIIITRSSNNYGPYQYPEKLIPLFITNALENKSLPLYGDGLNQRDWLYVEDNCKGIDLILHKGTPGQIYNIGVDNEKTNLEITNSILDLMSKPKSLIAKVKDRLAHDRRYSIDSSKVKQLGWKPQYDFMEGLKETVKWYIDNPKWWKKIKEKQTAYKEFYNKHYGERIKT